MKENLPNIDLNKVTLTQILKSLSDPIRLEIVTKLFKESKECSVKSKMLV